MNSIIKNALLFSGFIIILSACGTEDPAPVEPPFASFSFEVDETNKLMVQFTNNSVDGESFTWDFGDGSGTSTDKNPTYTYTQGGEFDVKLTATNAGGSDDFTSTVTVSGFGENLVTNGEFLSSDGWTSAPLWTADDNATLHGVVEGEFMFKNDVNADGVDYEWSNHLLFTPVELTAGETYKFEADLRSTGTNGVWFEIYLLDEKPMVDGTPTDVDGSLAQFFIKSYGDGENCGGSAFDDDIMMVAQACTNNSFDLLIDSDGYFTVSSEDIGADNTVYLTIKTGSGWGPDGTKAGYLDGIYMDNVSIKQVL